MLSEDGKKRNWTTADQFPPLRWLFTSLLIGRTSCFSWTTCSDTYPTAGFTYMRNNQMETLDQVVFQSDLHPNCTLKFSSASCACIFYLCQRSFQITSDTCACCAVKEYKMRGSEAPVFGGVASSRLVSVITMSEHNLDIYIQQLEPVFCSPPVTIPQHLTWRAAISALVKRLKRSQGVSDPKSRHEGDILQKSLIMRSWRTWDVQTLIAWVTTEKKWSRGGCEKECKKKTSMLTTRHSNHKEFVFQMFSEEVNASECFSALRET